MGPDCEAAWEDSRSDGGLQAVGGEPRPELFRSLVAFDPVLKQPAYFIFNALPFGATSSVYSFNRVAKSLWHIMVFAWWRVGYAILWRLPKCGAGFHGVHSPSSWLEVCQLGKESWTSMWKIQGVGCRTKFCRGRRWFFRCGEQGGAHLRLGATAGDHRATWKANWFRGIISTWTTETLLRVSTMDALWNRPWCSFRKWCGLDGNLIFETSWSLCQPT